VFNLLGPIKRDKPSQQAWMQVGLQLGEDGIVFEQHPTTGAVKVWVS